MIPCIDRFPKFSLASSEVGTIVWSDLFNLAPSRYKSSLCHQKKESVSKMCATSMRTARTAKQVNMTPYLFTRLRPRRTWKGQSIPTDVKGGRSGVWRSTGRSAIFCSQTGPWRPTHLESTLLSTKMMIQNYVPGSALFEAILIRWTLRV